MAAKKNAAAHSNAPSVIARSHVSAVREKTCGTQHPLIARSRLLPPRGAGHHFEEFSSCHRPHTPHSELRKIGVPRLDPRQAPGPRDPLGETDRMANPIH